MGLGLSTIALFIVIALVYALVIPADKRGWMLFLLSTVFVYSLQPDIFVRWLDFIFPTLTLLIVVVTWYFTRNPDQSLSQSDKSAFVLIICVILSLSILRYLPIDYDLILASRPPPITIILSLILGVGLVSVAINRLSIRYLIWLCLLIALFVILKTDAIATGVSQWIRAGTGQDISQASIIDLNWLGFSYVAFRLIHTIRDHQTGILPQLHLHEYMTYVVFFPSFIAGPIDRAERFLLDFRNLTQSIDFQERYMRGSIRIATGIFKKFIIADTLAQGMALNPINAIQADNMLGLWLLLYGYAFRLFFDFSGYTDIAIGIAILFGIDLPENFNKPYLQTSITKFWQSWHITLSNWVRTYVFSPLSRNLLRRRPKPSPILIVLITQLATMIVIGLWHGVTVNFLIWGIWHGLALFIHKQWQDNTRPFYRRLKAQPIAQRLADGFAWFITFHFAVLGWVWFALPEFDLALSTFAKLFGVSG